MKQPFFFSKRERLKAKWNLGLAVRVTLNYLIAYSLRSMIFEIFYKNKNTKDSMQNLQKCSIRT
jgi:hypothetical protein